MSERPAVLIVEDDFETRTLFRVIAQREGFEVVAAEDGEQALALLFTQRVDVILLDLLLPKVDGFAVMRHLRGARPELLARTIVITAAAEAMLRDREELLHVFCVRHKPMEVMEVATDLIACSRMDNVHAAPHAAPPQPPTSHRRVG